jgi:hypothetical protein
VVVTVVAVAPSPAVVVPVFKSVVAVLVVKPVRKIKLYVHNV